VRFSGGGGNHGSIAAVALEDPKKRELACWGSGGRAARGARRGDLGSLRAVPRPPPHQRDAPARQVVGAGERGGEKFEELLSAPRQPYRSPITSVAVTARDTSRASALRAGRGTAPAGAPEASRPCERCGEPLPPGLRAEARYCSKRCRQAASRARLKDRPPSPPPTPAETCAWCGGPMPAGVRVEARFCSKRCRQESSRHALRVRRSAPKTSSEHDSPRPRGATTPG